PPVVTPVLNGLWKLLLPFSTVRSKESSVVDVAVSVIPKALLTGELPKSPSVNVVENVPVAMLVLAVGEVMEDKAVLPLGITQAQPDPPHSSTCPVPQVVRSDRLSVPLVPPP